MDAPSELCPPCLLKTGMASQSESPAAGLDTTIPNEPGGEAGDGKPAVPLEAGQQFGGYRIVRRLGKGGMGAVYEAEHLSSGRRVALKVLDHSIDSPDARRRFLRSSRRSSMTTHGFDTGRQPP